MQSPTVRRIVGPTILLASGNYFDFLAPEESTFTIEDIATGLSNVCRFAGQCSRFYSVAQHSVIVSHHVPPAFAFAGLMHDAAEAFIGDVTKPLKDILPDYRALEERVERAVLGRFGLPHKMPPEVKEIDVVMLATEQKQLMRNRDDWNYTRGRQALDIPIPPMGPREAKAMFLAQFADLTTTLATAPAETEKPETGEAGR
ncbi:metal-dependent phosphohydrolase [Methylobacterium flocculans]|uniref:metal-dependent phosphohydrolase n=1 Tax=Methylobacterium flocculans TaxID=2984843 RepID=UPI0021F35C4F|nr:metal-dependent phosphohydrolase [Methylobacterium sp. FF17]